MSKQQQGLQVIHHVGQTCRVMQGAFSGMVGHALPRWRILLTLHERGQCSQKHLAEHCQLDPASLTRQLQAMQKLGWIARTVDTRDNRLTNARLTPAGQAVVDAALPKRAIFFEESLKGLSVSDIETLNRVLNVLEENFLRAAQDKRG